MCLHILLNFLLVLLHKRVNFLLVWALEGIVEAIYLYTRMCLHILLNFLLVLLHKRVNFLLVWALEGIIEAIFYFSVWLFWKILIGYLVSYIRVRLTRKNKFEIYI